MANYTTVDCDSFFETDVSSTQGCFGCNLSCIISDSAYIIAVQRKNNVRHFHVSKIKISIEDSNADLELRGHDERYVTASTIQTQEQISQWKYLKIYTLFNQ